MRLKNIDQSRDRLDDIGAWVCNNLRFDEATYFQRGLILSDFRRSVIFNDLQFPKGHSVLAHDGVAI